MNTKQNIKHLLSFALLLSMLTACNKKETDYEKAVQVLITGFNGSEGVLQVSIDTAVFDKDVAYGKYLIKPNSPIELNFAYTYRTSRKDQLLTITDTTTKKVVYSRLLQETGTKAQVNFIQLNGKEQVFNPPAAEASNNKLGFYIHSPEQQTAVDIFLYRKESNGETEYREYIAKNVQPNTWVYVNYQAPKAFSDKAQLGNATIYFTKAGTTDQWAFNEDENSSKISSGGMSFPLAGENGLVLPYFITPGVQLERTRMFFSPDRPW